MRATDQPATVHEAERSILRPRASLSLVVLSVLGVLAAMYVARDVLIPLAYALLLALLLSPLLRRMRWLRLPDLASAFILVVGVAMVFTLGVYLLAGQAQQSLAEAPAMVRKVGSMLPAKFGPLSDIEETTDAVQQMTAPGTAVKPLEVEVQSPDVALAVLGVSSQFVGSAVIAFVVAFFLLGFSDTLKRQATSSRSSFNERRNVVELLLNVERGISRYLATITLINIGLGIVTALMLWLLGIPNSILWGVMAATLNFVPHVGAFLCMVILFFVGAVTHASIGSGLLCAGAFMVLTSVESYFVTPMILSKSLQLSPLAVILAILFWGWLWGINGGLMAAPLLTIIKVVCDQFELLRGWSGVLAGASPKEMQTPPAVAARTPSAA
jgi:predicted PurR-regulated permease PerM